MIQINEIQADDRLTHVALVGQIDVAGLHAIDTKFHACTAGRQKPTIVDLSGLDFISSLGMGMFFSCAFSLQRFNVMMVLLNPRSEIDEALRAVGVDQVIPIVNSVEEGMRILFPAKAE